MAAYVIGLEDRPGLLLSHMSGSWLRRFRLTSSSDREVTPAKVAGKDLQQTGKVA